MTSKGEAGPEPDPIADGGNLPSRIRVRTLLAGIAIRPLAQSARRAGVDAASVDFFGDRDHRRALPVLSLRETGTGGYSARALVRLCRRVEADEVLYGADLENHPGLVARLSRGRRLLGNPPGVLRRVRDPFRLEASLRDGATPAPAVRRHDDPPPTDAGGSDWLRKPLRGGGGRDVRPWRPGEPLTGREYLQRRVRGTPVSLIFLSDGRAGRLLAASEMLVGREALGAQEFTYCGSLLRLAGGDTPAPPRRATGDFPWAEARELVRHLTADFGLLGLNGLDAVLDGGKLRPVEVNPRWTAAMELLEPGPAGAEARAGPTLFEMHRRACAGDLPTPGGTIERRIPRWWASLGEAGTPNRGADGSGTMVVGKAILRAPSDVRVPELAAPAGASLADVPEPGEEVPAGGPVCTFLSAGRDRNDCLERLEACAGRLRDALEP